MFANTAINALALNDKKLFFSVATLWIIPSDNETMDRTVETIRAFKLPLVQSSLSPVTVLDSLKVNINIVFVCLSRPPEIHVYIYESISNCGQIGHVL